MALLMVLTGLAALTLDAELLVRGLSSLASAIGLPSLVIGLILLHADAFGSHKDIIGFLIANGFTVPIEDCRSTVLYRFAL